MNIKKYFFSSKSILISSVIIVFSLLIFVPKISFATYAQEGLKLVGTGTVGGTQQGTSVSISSDGNTAITGGPGDDTSKGAVWVFTRTDGVWSQQGDKLVGTGAVGAAEQGTSVALSADGNTAVVGGVSDNSNVGAVWVFTRTDGVWSQQGDKLVGTGAVGTPQIGSSISLSSNGNTLIVGGWKDNSDLGAAWVFTRTGGVWSQQGSKLVGTGAVGAAYQGISVSISADGNKAIIGGNYDDPYKGAVWFFTRANGVWSQQGSKLVGTGATINAQQGRSVAFSADGGTALVGGNADNTFKGAVWGFNPAFNGYKVVINTPDGFHTSASSEVQVIRRTGSLSESNSNHLLATAPVISLMSDGLENTGWTTEQVTGTGGAWAFALSGTNPTVSPHGGSYLAKFNSYDVANTISARLKKTDSVALPENSTILLSFWMYHDNEYSSNNDRVQTQISTNGTDWTDVGTVVSRYSETVGWSQSSVDLTSYAGQTIYVAFVGISAYGNNIFVDDVLIGVPVSSPSYDWYRVAGETTQGKIGSSTTTSFNDTGLTGDGSIPPEDNTTSPTLTASIISVTNDLSPQVGSKLVGTGAIGNAQQGYSISASADGSTIIVGGNADNTNKGAIWVFINPNPTPVLTSISPTSTTTGEMQFTLTATGTDFVSTSTINWDGVALTTTYVSATELTAVVPAANLLSGGTINITVTNPVPGGGTSSTQTFTITDNSTSSGSRPSPKTVISTPIITPTTTETICPQGNKYSSVTGLPCTTFTSNPTISPTPTTCLITLTLRQGNKGEQVKCLQTKLNITSDGIFGPLTKAAVILFQKNHNLVQDGIVGPKTRGELL